MIMAIVKKEKSNGYLANNDGICRFRVYIEDTPVVSLCGMKHRYNEAENDMLINKIKFVRIVTAMVVADYSRFENFINGNDNKMLVSKEIINDMLAEMRLLRSSDVILGGKYLEQYKLAMAQAKNSIQPVYIEIL